LTQTPGSPITPSAGNRCTEAVSSDLGREGNLNREDIDSWLQDLRSRREDDDYLFSVNRYCFLAEAT